MRLGVTYEVMEGSCSVEGVICGVLVRLCGIVEKLCGGYAGL